MSGAVGSVEWMLTEGQSQKPAALGQPIDTRTFQQYDRNNATARQQLQPAFNAISDPFKAIGGDPQAQQRILQNVGQAMTDPMMVGGLKLLHGGGRPLSNINLSPNRGNLGNIYLTDEPSVAWKYAIGGGIDDSKNLAAYRREQLKQFPERNPSVSTVDINDPSIFEADHYNAWNSIPDNISPERLDKVIKEWSPETHEYIQGEAGLMDIPSSQYIKDNWGDFQQSLTDNIHLDHDNVATEKAPALRFLASTGLLPEYMAATKHNLIKYHDMEAGGNTFIPVTTGNISILNSGTRKGR